MKLAVLIDHLRSRGLDVSVAADVLEIEITGLAGLAEASGSELSFFADVKRLDELRDTQAAVVLIKSEHAQQVEKCSVIVDDPYFAYALVAQYLYPKTITPGIHPTAVIDSSVTVPESCQVDANVVISPGVEIADDVWIGANSFVGSDVSIAQGSHIYPNVTLMENVKIGSRVSIESGTVVGGQGFGFAPHAGSWHRIPQVGGVIIEDGVWIGNNCTIDRGAINNTVIGKNTIIDNLIHIAHNVEVGEGCAMAGQVGISGSVKVGNHCIMAGQVGIAGHLTITDNVQLMARSGVTRSITESGVYAGFPHEPVSDWQNNIARTKRLEKTNAKVKQLEQQLKELKKQLED